jgi:hypothetical protein
MTFSASLQPSLPADLADQSNLSTTMFNHIFETFQTQEQLDNSWEVIAQEIDIDERIPRVGCVNTWESSLLPLRTLEIHFIK